MDDIKFWLPPLLTLLGTLIVVTFTAWINTRSVHALIDASRFQILKDLAEVRGELKMDLLRIENKVDHIADVQARHSERLDALEKKS